MKMAGPIQSAAPAAPTQGSLIDDIVDPITGEILDPNNVDELIDRFEEIKKLADELSAARQRISVALAAKTEGETKTRRVAGKRRVAVVEFPSTRWDNATLKEAWNSYPAFRDQYLRISEIAPQLREVNKLRATSGPPDLETFKKVVLSAEREATAAPYVKIEK